MRFSAFSEFFRKSGKEYIALLLKNSQNMEKKTLAYLAALLNAVFIGLTFLFTKNSLAFAPPFTTLTFRFVLSFAAMALLLGLGFIKVDYSQGRLQELLFLAILQPVFFFSFQALGLLYISSSKAGVLNALIPVFVGIFGMVFLGEKVFPKQVAAFFLSFVGIFFLFLPEGCAEKFSLLGVGLTFLSVLSTSLYIVTGRKLTKSFDPMSLTFGMMATGAFVFFFLAFGFEGLTFQTALTLLHSSEFMAGILYLALFTSIGTSFLTVYSLKELEASKAAVFMNLCPVIAVAVGVFGLHETFGFLQGIGSSLILVGVLLAGYFGEIKQ